MEALFYLIIMEEGRNGIKGKERLYRRKTSKSPINIRGKIKELEAQMEKHHKQKATHKNMAIFPRQNSFKKQHPNR